MRDCFFGRVSVFYEINVLPRERAPQQIQRGSARAARTDHFFTRIFGIAVSEDELQFLGSVSSYNEIVVRARLDSERPRSPFFLSGRVSIQPTFFEWVLASRFRGDFPYLIGVRKKVDLSTPLRFSPFRLLSFDVRGA